MVGATGLEPAISWSQTTRVNQTPLRPGSGYLRLALRSIAPSIVIL